MRDTIESDFPLDLAADEGGVWVASGGGGLWRIESGRDTASRSISIGGRLAGVAVGFGSVSVADSERRIVARVDPVDDKLVDTIPVSGIPVDVAVGDGLVWVAVD